MTMQSFERTNNAHIFMTMQQMQKKKNKKKKKKKKKTRLIKKGGRNTRCPTMQHM